MLDDSLKFIEQKVIDNLEANGLSYTTELGNLASMTSKKDKVVISLISLKEESTLVNKPNYEEINNQLIRKAPALYLNIDLMFSFTFDTYSTCLTVMSHVLEFFQTHSAFTQDMYPELSGIKQMQFKIKSQETEQLHNIWSILGGNFYPSVTYSVKLVELEVRESEGPVIPIEEIEVNSTRM